jgi:hypothetical protein
MAALAPPKSTGRRFKSCQPAVMVSPPVIRRLGDIQLFQHGSDVTALGEDAISVLDFPNDLLRRMPLLSLGHDLHSLPAS